jgi:hypothetical protein
MMSGTAIAPYVILASATVGAATVTLIGGEIRHRWDTRQRRTQQIEDRHLDQVRDDHTRFRKEQLDAAVQYLWAARRLEHEAVALEPGGYGVAEARVWKISDEMSEALVRMRLLGPSSAVDPANQLREALVNIATLRLTGAHDATVTQLRLEASGARFRFEQAVRNELGIAEL